MIDVALRGVLRLAPSDFRERFGSEYLAVAAARRRGRSGVAGVVFAAIEMGGAVRMVAGLWIQGQARGLHHTGAREGGTGMLENAAQDVRYAMRTLGRNPRFAATAVIILALGIGANTAIFSAVNAYFFRPLPFEQPARLVTLFETNPEFGWTDAAAAPANVLDWREQVDAFEDVSAYSEFTNQVTTIRGGEPVLVGATAVMGNFFSTLGAPPALGRTFRFDETWAGADGGVVISHDLWVSYFGADPDVVGKKIEFAAGSVEVVGVMPSGFRFPSELTQVWTTFGWDESAREEVSFRRAHWVRAFARLAPAATAGAADLQLQIVVERLADAYPETNRVMGAGMLPLRDFLVRDVRTPLLVLVGAVAVLLLLACVNVANLLLVRANDRAREVALRYALGAGRLRVVRQMLTESLVIALLGGGLGLALGWIGVKWIEAYQRVGIDGATGLALDFRVVAFTLAAAGLSGLLFGTAPAFKSLWGDVHGAMREGGRGQTAGAGSLRAVSGLVVVEVALALMLVVGAGLMVRSGWLLRQVDPGFEREGILAVQFTVPSGAYATRDEVLAFHDRFSADLESRPGIERVGRVGQLPLAGPGWSSQFQAEGWPAERVGLDVLHRRADAGYFAALDIPLLSGRMFDERDAPGGPLAVVINQTFAQMFFQGEDPLGQKIAYDRVATPESNWYEIIGVVGDQQQVSPGLPARPEAFEQASQDWSRTVWFVVRGEGHAEGLASTVVSVLGELDPLIPISRRRALRDVWVESMAREDFVLALLTVFGVVALLLAGVGVYGVTAQAARRRTREIGIRMALGAAAPDVLRLMLRQGLLVIAVGLAVGLAASLLATRALGSLLFQIEPTDPATLAAVVALLGGIAAVACWVPARQATAVDPVRSLRSE